MMMMMMMMMIVAFMVRGAFGGADGRCTEHIGYRDDDCY